MGPRRVAPVWSDRGTPWLLALTALGLLLQLPTLQLPIPLRVFLPLHTLLEFASIVAAFLVFATVWYTPSNAVSASWRLIAVALLSAGWLDLGHMLSYLGMPELVSAASARKSVAFWLAARLTVAVTLLLASYAPRRWRARYPVLAGYAALNLLLVWIILWHEHWLPIDADINRALWSLKNALESLVTAIMLFSAWRYRSLARAGRGGDLAPLYYATLVGGLGGLFVVNHEIVSDLRNLCGHVYKVASYGLLFHAMFLASVRRPYRQLSEQAQVLRRANDKLRTRSLALSSTALPVYVTDADGGVQWRNRAAQALLPRHAAAHQLFEAPMTADPAQAASMRATLAAGLVWRGLVQVADGRGQFRTFDRMVTPLRTEHGALDGYVVTAEDVTQSIAAQLRYKRVLDTALDGFLILDRAGALLEVNQAYAGMSGYTVAQLLTMNIAALEAASFAAEVPARMERVMRDGQLRLQSRHRHADGHEIEVELSVTFDPASRSFFVFVHDRTAYEAAAAMRADLERQLLQSQKMQSLGQLTGGIAHDFNNALAAILGYANLALSRCVADPQGKLAHYLGEITAASERARALVAKMLAFARMQPSGPAVPVAPAVVIAEVLAMLRPSIPSGIMLRSTVEDDSCVLMVEGELNQLLVNLIINARDAIGEQGNILVRVRRLRVAGRLCAISHRRLSGEYLAIGVSDDGGGIAPEHLARLFDPFFTTKEVGQGTGLGLSMLQSIVLRSHGHVLVDSAYGEGSKFEVLLPLATPALPPPAARQAAAAAAAVAQGGGQRLWVVDDQPAVLRCMGEWLEHAGYHVRLFHQPRALLAALRRTPEAVDLVLTDQTMPGMNGMALAARVHRLRPRLPIFLCTGYRDSIAPAALRAEGIVRCFDKPVTPAQLLQALAETLSPVGYKNDQTDQIDQID